MTTTAEPADEHARAWESALRLLNYRERSRKEIFDKLAGKGYSAAAIGTVVERLTRLDLLDDEKFARLWVRSRVRFRPRAAWLIGRELRAKGIEEGLARRVMDEEMPPDREREAVREMAKKRARYYRGEPPDAARRKLFFYLARRGFASDTIRECIDDLVGGDEHGE
ncbi:MAG: regulatory protein RecX [PVC group bacterium]